MRTRSVLVVEDHATNVMVMTAFLDEMGYDYDVATDGLQAIEQVRNTDYALILMDLSMPKLDGIETTRRIRALEQEMDRKPVSIIALTGYVSDIDRARCLEAGMQGHMSKPFRLEGLSALLQEFVGPPPSG